MKNKQSKRFKHKTRKSKRIKRFKPTAVRLREKREAAVQQEASGTLPVSPVETKELSTIVMWTCNSLIFYLLNKNSDEP